MTDIVQARKDRIRKMALKVGDRVRYSRDFLRDTRQFTGEAPFMRGQITELQPWGGGELATLDCGQGEVRNVDTWNLARDDGRRETESAEWACHARL